MKPTFARPAVLGLCLSATALVIAGNTTSGCFGSADDCDLTLGYGCTTATASSSAGGSGGWTTSGSGASTSSGTAGSGGAPPDCTDAAECTAVTVPPGPCASLGKVVCAGGKCGVDFTPGDAPSQRFGDCQRWVCDAAGQATLVADDTDVYDDGNPCTAEACSGGAPSRVDLPTGSTCALGGASGFCAAHPYTVGLVFCAECNPAAPGSCTGALTCSKGTCVPLHCTNGVKDSGETDKDCGGTVSGCLKCIDTQVCTSYKDCWSATCATGTCQASACTDGKQNNSETDQDCGGLLCDPCVEFLMCVVPGDCKSGVCLPAATAGEPNTCALPTCADGVQNGNEAGLDCGGPDCPPCAI